MNRRRFLLDLLSASAALAVAGPATRAFAGDPAQFAAGLERHPWMAGWRQVSAEALGPTRATLEGRLPDGFAGTLYRNGPAWFERDGFRYEHWFDGDGMVHGWRFGDGGVVHRGRMVATPKFEREKALGRFATLAAGTTVPNLLPIRNNDDANTANTAVTVIGGRLFALCEAGSAFELDPDTLATLGPVTWRPDLAAVPFSAHPLVDRDGTSWNFGSIAMMGGNGLLVWHVDARGALISADVLETPEPGYLHAFAMTDRHLVFMLIPVDFQQGGSFFERMRFASSRACRVAVVDKATPSKARWFETGFTTAYHFGDAYERRGRIVMRTVQHLDPDEARSPMKAAMQGHDGQSPKPTRLVELHLDLKSGKAHWETLAGDGIEFPLFDARSRGDRPARLYAPTRAGDSSSPYFNAVAMLDPERGRREVYRYGRDILAEEHVFVPRRGSTKPDDGWLVGTLLDPAHGRSGVAILDARRVAAGPVAQAWVPYTFPLGFHGTFAAAA